MDIFSDSVFYIQVSVSEQKYSRQQGDVISVCTHNLNQQPEWDTCIENRVYDVQKVALLMKWTQLESFQARRETLPDYTSHTYMVKKHSNCGAKQKQIL